MRLTVVCQDVRSWRSGHDAAVHATIRALVEAGAEVRVLAGRVHPGAEIPGVAVSRLPCLPVWHGSLQFFTVRLAYALRDRPEGLVYLASPLLGRGDAAAVHFLSRDWLAALRPVAGGWRSRLRRAHDLFRHTLAARLEDRAYGAEGPLLLPVSEGLAERLRSLYPACAPRLRVVPSPLDTAVFTPGDEPVLRRDILAAAGWPDETRLLLFVGGAWTRKRLDRAIRALVALPASVCLLVIGAGPEGEMLALARRLGVAGRVAFLGPRTDVPRLLRLGLALVLPSDYETDGRVAWEALASGVPVIAAPFVGSEGWLRDGETAFAATRPEDIAAAVRRLLEEPGLGPRLGRRGRALVRETRAPEVVAARLLAVLREARP